MPTDLFVVADREDRARHEMTPIDMEGLIRYRDKRIKPGSFMTAVLENDLIEAAARADVYHRRRLFEIVEWCTWNLPAQCWGSPKAVKDWLEKRD